MFRVTLHNYAVMEKYLSVYCYIKYLLLDCLLGSWNEIMAIVFLHYPLHMFIPYSTSMKLCNLVGPLQVLYFMYNTSETPSTFQL